MDRERGSQTAVFAGRSQICPKEEGYLCEDWQVWSFSSVHLIAH